MKKIISILIILILFITVSCKKKDSEVVSISCSNIEFKVDNVDITKLKINVSTSNGSKETIDAKKEYLSSSDYNSLNNVGIHKVTINYSGLSCTSFINITSDKGFRVTIVNDEEELLNEYYTEKVTIKEPTLDEKEGYILIAFKNHQGEFFDFTKEIDENTYLYAYYERKLMYINFFDKDTLILTKEVYYGDTLDSIPEAKRDGFIFMGWNIELNNLEIKENMDVIAKFCPVSGNVHVIFMVDGEVYQEGDFAYGSYITGIPDPEVAGKTFVSWDYNLNEAVFEDITINAIFK